MDVRSYNEAWWPMSEVMWDGFFDNGVQKVLGRRKASAPMLEACKSETERMWVLAYPLCAFMVCKSLADNLERASKHIDFLWLYGCDAAFAADLLVVVTAYFSLPRSKWKKDRALASLAFQYEPNSRAAFEAAATGQDFLTAGRSDLLLSHEQLNDLMKE